MPKQLSAAVIAILIACSTLSAVPIRADEAASNAVKQSYLAMQSVHSYRIKTVTHQSGRGATDVTSLSELTQSPQRMHTFFTIGPEKAEQIVAGTTLYMRVEGGSWKKDASPAVAAPRWGFVWSKRYDAGANYAFVRRAVLDSKPMTVYAATQPQRFRRTDTEIWIGARDHLPYKIIRRTTGGGNFQTVVTETLSDFNSPIKIAVPK